MFKKLCTRCMESKNLDEFSNNKNTKDGKIQECKLCSSKRYKEYYDNNKTFLCEKGRKKHKGRSQEIKDNNLIFTNDEIFNNTKSKRCVTCKEHLSSNNFHINRYSKDGLNNKCKNCRSTKSLFISKICDNCNIDKPSDEYKTNTKGSKICKKCLNKKKNTSRTLEQKIKGNVRNIIWQSFNRACEGTYKKSAKTEELLGCTMEFFKHYLENLFEEGMRWDNNGRCKDGDCTGLWHIDHKIPLITAKTEEDIIELCHYTNLQPLWALNNLKKGGNKF